MPHLRSFRSGDEPALTDICLRTGDAGADATGILVDDDLWGQIFVLPYVVRHPDLAFVVEPDDGRVVGYVVGTQALRERGAQQLHLVASADNAGALAFYERLGFEPLPSHLGAQAFGIELSEL